MLSEFLRTGPEVLEFQDQIDQYRKHFYEKSNGFQLPPVEYLGSFKKYGQNIKDSEEALFVSIPIKNQEDIIISVITTLIKNTKQFFTIGLLFDNCTDSSESICREFLKSNFEKFDNLIQVHFIKSNGELFEATCENILFLFCKADYFVSLQADIFLKDATFFDRGIKFFNEIPKLFAISGRAVVPFGDISKLHEIVSLFLKYYRKIIEILKLNSGHRILGPYVYGLKYFGDISDPPKTKMDFTSREFQKIYFGEAVIRGPIIWKSDLFEFFSGFNDISYVLGRDECDLCFRASNNGFIVGYIPSLSYSFKEMGTSRKIRTPDVQNHLIEREKIAKENPGELTLLWKNSRGIKSGKVSKLETKLL